MTNKTDWREELNSLYHKYKMEIPEKHYVKIESFIQRTISDQVTIAVEDERNHWLNQSANDHDNKIREAERKRILELPVMKGEKVDTSFAGWGVSLLNRRQLIRNQLREELRQQIRDSIEK